MTRKDSQPPENTRHDTSDSSRPKTPQSEWVLTPEAFDNLLSHLSPDRDEAGKEYEAVRIKIVRYFERYRIDSAEDCADEVFNRVARKLVEGQQIDNVISYTYRVAYFVLFEVRKEPAGADIDLDTVPSPEPDPDIEQDIRQRCFDDCLTKLTDENRNLILTYHREEGHTKIELRKQLADTLRIPLNALRIRAHRIRVGLEKCIKECMTSDSLGRNVTG